MNQRNESQLPDNVRRLDAPPPPPPQGGPIFWAERDPAIQWRSTAMMLLIMAPLAFFAPASFITSALAVVAMGWWNGRGFRFQIDRQALTLRAAQLAPTLTIPLKDIAEVSMLPDAAALLMPLEPKSGHLLVKKTDGEQLLIPGVKEAAEAIDAFRKLKQPTEEPGQDRAAA